MVSNAGYYPGKPNILEKKIFRQKFMQKNTVSVCHRYVWSYYVKENYGCAHINF